jgi:hypothetical protein
MPVPTGEDPERRQVEVTDAELDEILTGIEPRGTRQKAPARKGPGLLMLGCFGFLVFTVAVVLAVGGMALLRASNAGVTFEMYKQQPQLASAAIGAALNPNMELVKVDRYRAQLTIRTKQTGQTRTVTAEALRRSGTQGFGGGQQAGKSGGKGGLLSLFRSGARILGMGPSLPEWLPSYPGAKAGGNMMNENVTGVVGVARFTTDDRAAHVFRFYDQKLRDAGFAVTVEQSGVDGAGSVTAHSSKGGKTVVVRVSRTGDKTSISMTYSQPS